MLFMHRIRTHDSFLHVCSVMEEVGQQEEEEEVVAVILQRHKQEAIQVQCSFHTSHLSIQ